MSTTRVQRACDRCGRMCNAQSTLCLECREKLHEEVTGGKPSLTADLGGAVFFGGLLGMLAGATFGKGMYVAVGGVLGVIIMGTSVLLP